MRLIGSSAYGIRLPIISTGDDLSAIIAEAAEGIAKKPGLDDDDIIGITESIVAKAQGNYAGIQDLAEDVRRKFQSGTVGVVFPILSRNRFLNILKGIALGAEKVAVLLSFPADEVGNPILDITAIDELEDELGKEFFTAAEFKALTKNYAHPFTGIDYISLYESVAPNIEVYVANKPKSILKITDHVIVAEIHSRNLTKKRLLNAGAKTVYTLSDLLSVSVNGSGYNSEYGVLGSNLSTGERLKLFPRDCREFVQRTRALIYERTGKSPEILVYGDGAFKDPLYGIWELADPVVSPAYTERLGGQPNEMKLKYIADNVFAHLAKVEKTNAVSEMIRGKDKAKASYSEGTTPRKYADLLGSLCDLMSGSGDKGTPVVLIKGYFDNYSDE